MEEMQRRLRDEIDTIKQSWGSRVGTGTVAPKYNFSRLAPIRRFAQGAGRSVSRVEMLYEHLQEEVANWQAHAGADEFVTVLYITARGDVVQVGSIGYRTPDLLVIEGVDDTNQRTRVLVPAGTAELMLKIMKAAPDAAGPSTDFVFSGEQRVQH